MKILRFIILAFLIQLASIQTVQASDLFVDESSPYFQPIQQCIGDKPSQLSNCHYEEFLLKLNEDDVELALEFCESEFNWPPSRGWARCAVLADDISYCDQSDKQAECMSLFYSPVYRPDFDSSDLISMGASCKAENILDKCHPQIRDACKELELDSCESVITENYSAEIYAFFLEWKDIVLEDNRVQYYLPDFFQCPRNVVHTPNDQREANDQCILETTEEYLDAKDELLSDAEVETLIFACNQISDTYLASSPNTITIPDWQKCVSLVAEHQGDPNLCLRNKRTIERCTANLLSQQPKAERAETCAELEGDDASECMAATEVASVTFLSIFSEEAFSINVGFLIAFFILFAVLLFIRFKTDNKALEYPIAVFVFIDFLHLLALGTNLFQSQISEAFNGEIAYGIFVGFFYHYTLLTIAISDYFPVPWLYILISDLSHFLLFIPLGLTFVLRTAVSRAIAMIVLMILILFGINFLLIVNSINTLTFS